VIAAQAAVESSAPAYRPVLAVTFGFGLACFVLPLWGIHDRLVREKARLLLEVERRLGRLSDEMYRRIDAGQFDGTKVVSDALSGVIRGRPRRRICR
jgi:hypothetical protein